MATTVQPLRLAVDAVDAYEDYAVALEAIIDEHGLSMESLPALRRFRDRMAAIHAAGPDSIVTVTDMTCFDGNDPATHPPIGQRLWLSLDGGATRQPGEYIGGWWFQIEDQPSFPATGSRYSFSDAREVNWRQFDRSLR